MFTPNEKGSGSAMLHVAPLLRGSSWLSVAAYIGGVAGCRGHYGQDQDPGHAAPLGRHGHQDTLLAQHPLQVTRIQWMRCYITLPCTTCTTLQVGKQPGSCYTTA